MICSHCGAKTHVLSTRDGVFRTRECKGPEKHRFATTEYSGPEVKRLRDRANRFDRVRALLLKELEGT